MRPVILYTLLTTSLSIWLMSISLWFGILTFIFISIFFFSHLGITIKEEDSWSLGFILLGRSKKVYGHDRYRVCIYQEMNKYKVVESYVYVFKDNLFYCKQIGERFDYRDITTLKSRVNSIMKRELDTIERQNYSGQILKNFKKWDGCLDDQNSRDKKLEKIL